MKNDKVVVSETPEELAKDLGLPAEIAGIWRERHSKELVDHVVELEKKLLRPDVRSNAIDLEQLLHAEFSEIGASGTFWTRDDVVERLPSEEPTVSLKATNFQEKQISEEIVHLTYQTEKQSDKSVFIVLRSSIWKKNSDQKWQLFFHQGTPAK